MRNPKLFGSAIAALILGCIGLADDAKPKPTPNGDLTGVIVLLPSERSADNPEFHLKSGDVTSAKVGADDDGKPMLMVVFSRQKREEFSRFTSANAGAKVWVMVNGNVVSELTIRSEIHGPGMQIYAPSKSDAEEAVRLLMQKPALP
jgi:preprotein translocase subunit SecD